MSGGIAQSDELQRGQPAARRAAPQRRRHDADADGRVSTVAPGSNEVAGVEGQFQFYQNLALNTYIAKSWTTGLHGDDLSYRGQINYNADRYGLQIDRLVVEDNFNPGGRLPASRELPAQLRIRALQPATGQQSRRSGSTATRSGFEYTTDNHNRLESRELQGTFRIEQQNSDLWVVDVTHATTS